MRGKRLTCKRCGEVTAVVHRDGHLTCPADEFHYLIEKPSKRKEPKLPKWSNRVMARMLDVANLGYVTPHRCECGAYVLAGEWFTQALDIVPIDAAAEYELVVAGIRTYSLRRLKNARVHAHLRTGADFKRELEIGRAPLVVSAHRCPIKEES